MDKKYILAIDQGTSGTKAVLFNKNGEVAARHDLPHGQFYPHEGWVEQDGLEIWNNTVSVIGMTLKSVGSDGSDVACLSITDQTETFLLWDKKTGIPVTPVIGWQDGRASDLVQNMEPYSKLFEDKTGIPLSPYYSAAKLKYILDNDAALYNRVRNNEILFGTIECWLIWNLTGGNHVSDLCDASRSQLINIHTLEWDDELLKIFDFPRAMFPSLLSCDDEFGTINVPDLPALKITGVVGDSPGALFGQKGFNEGDVKVTYGTGSSVLMNLGSEASRIGGGITTTIGWVISGKPTYVCEGSILCSAATIKWLQNDLQLIQSAAETESLALQIPDTGGVYLIPAFTGMGSPWWDDKARAAVIGMTRGTGKAQFVRAALESIAYQVKDCVEMIKKNSAIRPGVLRADGGASRNKFLMQFQSDILNQKISCSYVEESSALGAAMIGGLSCGFFRDRQALEELFQGSNDYSPDMSEEKRQALYSGWSEALKRIVKV